MSKHAPRGPMKSRPAKNLKDVVDPTDVVQHLRGTPLRCTATAKGTGLRCENPARYGAAVCRTHGGNAPQVLASARERLMALQPLAVTTLHGLLDREEYPTVQLGAAREVFDRTEGKPAQAVAITGKDDGPLEIVIRKPWADVKNP